MQHGKDLVADSRHRVTWHEIFVSWLLDAMANDSGPDRVWPSNGGFVWYTLWLFNIAMENYPFIDDFPIKTTIYRGFSMAVLNNQMVVLLGIAVWLQHIVCPIESVSWFRFCPLSMQYSINCVLVLFHLVRWVAQTHCSKSLLIGTICCST